MKSLQRTTIGLASALFALLCLYIGSFWIQSAQRQRFSGRLIPAQDRNEIAEIRFFIPTKAEPVEMGNMVLKKRQGRFYLVAESRHYAVRDTIIERFFSVLAQPRAFIPISKSVRTYADYGIDDAHAAKIVLVKQDGTFAAELFFGITDTLGINRYVRTGRSLTVFAIDNAVDPFLTIAHGFWLDLQLYKALFAQTSIQNLEMGKHYIIRNLENAKDFSALEHFLQTCTCIGLYTAPVLQSPATENIRLLLGSGDTLQLFFTPLQNGDYVFFDNRSPNAYVISGYTAAQLLQKVHALIAP
ncbi:MAG: DUF4340 domain-containing protein [Treponema sp.]